MSTKKLRIAYLMDPLDGMDISKDTTFAFLLEAQSRGHENFVLGPADLAIRRSVPEARVQPVQVRRKVGDHFELGEARREALEAFDVVMLRKDPPFDMNFFFDTHTASLIDAQKTLVVNNPAGLRDANEKLYALRFPDVIPASLVTADSDLLKEFLAELGGEMIVKPLDGCGGKGIFHVHDKDRNLNAILESSTAHGTIRVMAQRYLPEVREGDKRIIVIEGEPRGAVLRIPQAGEHRSNFHVGGSAARSQLTERDREICARIADDLRRDGLLFVGLDVIGGFLTEVNVTSPTGVQEIDDLSGTNLAGEWIDVLEARCA
ncbi:MAG: glutathione synthase [Deltaproteobacteria bacterium]